MASTHIAGAGASSGATPSGQNPHPLLENNEEKNRYVRLFAQLCSRFLGGNGGAQRRNQSGYGRGLADRKDELDGQIC